MATNNFFARLYRLVQSVLFVCLFDFCFLLVITVRVPFFRYRSIGTHPG